MANYRQIHCRMWSSDNWFIELKPDLKLLFVYLFSNERSTMCGLFELPLRIISFETGLDLDTITRGLEVFNKADKVKYDFETGVVWVKNAIKYQSQANPNDKVLARIKADIAAVPDCALKTECIHTLPVAYGQRADAIVSVSSGKGSVSVSLERGGVGEKTIFELYEQEIGSITPMIADAIADWEKDVPAQWIRDAIQEAVKNNARNWKYVEAILKRWHAQGNQEAALTSKRNGADKQTAVEALDAYGKSQGWN